MRHLPVIDSFLGSPLSIQEVCLKEMVKDKKVNYDYYLTIREFRIYPVKQVLKWIVNTCGNRKYIHTRITCLLPARYIHKCYWLFV